MPRCRFAITFLLVLFCFGKTGTVTVAQTQLTPNNIDSHLATAPSKIGNGYYWKLNSDYYISESTGTYSDPTSWCQFLPDFTTTENPPAIVSVLGLSFDHAALETTGTGMGNIGLGINGQLNVSSARNQTFIEAAGVDGGIGLVIAGDFTVQRATITATADGDNSIGIMSWANILFENSATINAKAVDASGIGIYAINGNININGTKLQLLAGEGYSVVADNALNFSSYSTAATPAAVVLQADAYNREQFGRISASTVGIAQGTKLSVELQNSVALSPQSPLILHFIEADSITGTFDLQYISDNLNYTVNESEGLINIFRVHYPSDFADGNNKNTGRGIEQGLIGHQDMPGYEGANDLFDWLDRQLHAKDINRALRRSSGWQAEKFANVMMSGADLRQNLLFNHLTLLRTSSEYEALAGNDYRGQVPGRKVNPWTRWVSWSGNAEYDGGNSASYEDLRFDSAAFNVGMARRADRFGRRTHTGFNFAYNYGNFRDGNRSEDKGFTKGNYQGFSGAINVRHDAPICCGWMDWSLGGGVNNFSMTRRDWLGVPHESDTTSGLLRLGWSVGRDYPFRTRKYIYYYEYCRLTPILGIDYTLVTQEGLRENNLSNGMGLRGEGDVMHAVRGKIGGEFAYCYTDLSFSAHSYLRCDFLDQGLNLPMSLATAPLVNWTSQPQSVSRVTGVIGFNLTCRMFENQDIGLSYDGAFRTGGSTHWFDLRYVRRF